jgi:uncharacterized protein YvpB
MFDVTFLSSGFCALLSSEGRESAISRRNTKHHHILTISIVLFALSVCVFLLGYFLYQTAQPTDPTIPVSQTTATAATTTTTVTTTKTTTTKTTTTTTQAPTTTTTVRAENPTGTTSAKPTSFQLSVPYISQKEKYLSGCESVSAVMALNYLGVNITVDAFIDQYLPCGGLWRSNGRLYGDDPNERFIGDPYTNAGYGCFAPVIEKACQQLLPADKYTVSTVRGKTLAELCDTYVSQGIPVPVWVTIGMIPSFQSTQWQLADGSTYTWPANEHCMVLVGWDETGYWFNDPYNGRGVVHFSRWLAEQRYAEMGSQAVVIQKSTQ